jgi:hypothetical protein
MCLAHGAVTSQMSRVLACRPFRSPHEPLRPCLPAGSSVQRIVAPSLAPPPWPRMASCRAVSARSALPHGSSRVIANPCAPAGPSAGSKSAGEPPAPSVNKLINLENTVGSKNKTPWAQDGLPSRREIYVRGVNSTSGICDKCPAQTMTFRARGAHPKIE